MYNLRENITENVDYIWIFYTFVHHSSSKKTSAEIAQMWNINENINATEKRSFIIIYNDSRCAYKNIIVSSSKIYTVSYKYKASYCIETIQLILLSDYFNNFMEFKFLHIFTRFHAWILYYVYHTASYILFTSFIFRDAGSFCIEWFFFFFLLIIISTRTYLDKLSRQLFVQYLSYIVTRYLNIYF